MSYRYLNITLHTMEPHDRRTVRKMITDNLATLRPPRHATWLY